MSIFLRRRGEGTDSECVPAAAGTYQNDNMIAIVNTIISVLYVAVPVLAGLFVFWSNSKKDGFDQEKIYDLLIIGLIGSAILGILPLIILNQSFYPDIIKPNAYSLVFGFMATISLFVLKWRWSLYRVLDNLSVSFVMLLAFLLPSITLRNGLKPLYLLASILLFISYVLLQRNRGTFLKSGFTYCLISTVLCLAAAITTQGILNLIFLGLLFTLTLAVLIYRVRSLYGRSKVDDSSPHNL